MEVIPLMKKRESKTCYYGKYNTMYSRLEEGLYNVHTIRAIKDNGTCKVPLEYLRLRMIISPTGTE